jgi:hypothetical protein
MRGGKRERAGRPTGSTTSDRTEQFTKRITPEEKTSLDKFLINIRSGIMYKDCSMLKIKIESLLDVNNTLLKGEQQLHNNEPDNQYFKAAVKTRKECINHLNEIINFMDKL